MQYALLIYTEEPSRSRRRTMSHGAEMEGYNAFAEHITRRAAP